MVKLVGNDTMEEIEAYFDYDNNFTQLLEDYITKSSEVQKILNRSSSKDRLKQIRNIRFQMKKLYQDGDHEKPRIKLFKTWMNNLYEQKKMKYHKKDNDLEKDELIRNLKNELLQKNETIIQLENENKYYSRKIKKLRKQLNLDKPKPKPAPVPEPEPSPELLKMMDPDYDSDDDIVEKPPPAPRPKPEPKEEPKEELPSIYSNHLTSQEEKEKDEYEQQIKAECERKAREREEDIEKKEKIEKIMETYYSQCDLEIDKMLKKFNKEVKKADRIKKSIKNDYIDSLEDILLEIQEEYLENHDELEEVSKERKLKMITRPIDIFESRLPSEMVQVQIESGN
jgi:hypothetical protein